ncbi:MAG: thymidylate kinase [Thermoplasmata archaeon]|nr:thymidylate kinase [Thermoplasmata archaeon]MCI4353824.1 thymidylate kinase [Thermoplasmata archaeon]
MRKTYGSPPPGFSSEHLRGHLIVLEGADGSGRTTEVALLRDWLEIRGHPVVDTGLRRSTLVGPEIDRAKQGHTLSATTMALFYAADFADQLENKILPSLAAGSTVLADRYVYTLMARAVARGATRDWASRLYGFAIIPDLTVFLDARPEILLHRAIGRYGSLDYWESGMDLSLSRDRFESFFRYQERLHAEFEWMTEHYGFEVVDANRDPTSVHKDVVRWVAPLYEDGHDGELDAAPTTPRRARARPAAPASAPTPSAPPTAPPVAGRRSSSRPPA